MPTDMRAAALGLLAAISVAFVALGSVAGGVEQVALGDEEAENRSLVGLEPGMHYKEALKRLGEPQSTHRFDLPKRGQRGVTEEHRLYGWEDRQRDVEIEVNDTGEILLIRLSQKRGSTRGPLGVLIGQDTLAKAIERIGRSRVQAMRNICSSEGPVVLLGFVSCGGETQASIYYIVDITSEDEALCNRVPSIDDLLRLVGQAVIRDASLESRHSRRWWKQSDCE